MTIDPKSANHLFNSFAPNSCDFCGQCLSECPVMKITPSKGKEMIHQMLDGEYVFELLENCQSCLACSVACPQHNNPAMLILDNFAKRYREAGHSKRSLHFHPHQPNNFRANALRFLPPDERELVASMNSVEPCEEFLYPGCNLTAAAYLLMNPLLEGQQFRGGMNYCCGETLFRMGMEDELRAVASHLSSWIEKLGAKRMKILCTAGANIFANVLPQYGFTPKLEIIPMLPELLSDVVSGRRVIKNPFEWKVTVQDSCYAKVLGDEYLDVPRKILESCGCRIEEMSHSRCSNLCCIGAGFGPESAFNPSRIIQGAVRILRQANATGAQAIITYCGGCTIMLSAMKWLYPTAPPVYHILQILGWACGYSVPDRNIGRGFVHLYGVIRHQFPLLANRKRIHLAPFNFID